MGVGIGAKMQSYGGVWYKPNNSSYENTYMPMKNVLRNVSDTLLRCTHTNFLQFKQL